MNTNRIRALGAHIESEWVRCNRDEETFPTIAESCLREWDGSDGFDARIAAECCLRDPSLTRQVDSHFSDLTLVPYEGTECLIQVLVWMDGAMDIHYHSFSGAFRLLEGSSIHSRYQFEVCRRINSHMSTGTVRLGDVELLRRGDTRAIRAGDVAHCLFHLDRPSVTLVVRTRHEPWAAPQCGLIPPDLMVDGSSMRSDGTVNALIKCLRVMHAVEDPSYDETVRALILALDFPRLYVLFRRIRGDLGDDLTQYLQVARETHGDLADYLVPREGEERKRRIQRLRHSVSDPDLRFFLALLMLLPTRDLILEVTRQYFPSASPERTVANWTARLLENGVLPFQLGGEGAAEVIEGIVRGLSVEELVEEMRVEFGSAEVEAQIPIIKEIYEDIGMIPELAPLLISGDSVRYPRVEMAVAAEAAASG